MTSTPVDPPTHGSGGNRADTSVRVAWADDAAAIARVQLDSWQHDFADLPGFDPTALAPETVAEAWHLSLTRPGDARNRVLVALQGNQVVGFAVTTAASDPDCDPIRDGELGEWCVQPAERGHGHGARLLQAAVDTMVADRFSRAVIWLLTGDEARMGYLRKAGWAADGAHRGLTDEDAGGSVLKQVRWHTLIGG